MSSREEETDDNYCHWEPRGQEWGTEDWHWV